MKYFAGLDVPLEETAICIVDGNCKVIGQLMERWPAGSAVTQRLHARFHPRSEWRYDAGLDGQHCPGSAPLTQNWLNRGERIFGSS